MPRILEETRPWGNFRVLMEEEGFLVKRIEVSPKKRLSLQSHKKRSERWTIAKGEGKMTLCDREFPVKAGDLVRIEKGETHRIENTGEVPLILIEVQLGEELDENDIVRLQDDFGR